MSYVVTNTRGQIIAVVQDGTIDTVSTSQTLVGKNVTPYGEYEIENLVHQLENFANDTPPGNPIEGQIWWDTNNKLLKGWNGTAWVSVSPDATSLNVNDKIVKRDAYGDFSAGIVTATGVSANSIIVNGTGGNSTLGFRDSDGNVFDTKIYYANATNNLNIAVNSNVIASFSQTGATFNYPVTVPQTPTANTQAASKGYVDSALAAAPYGQGTVSSVGITAGNGIIVSGGPITSSGNITVSVNAQSGFGANTVMGRDSSGSFSANTATLSRVSANIVVSTGNASGSYLRMVDNVGDVNDTFVWYENASQSIKLQVNGNTPATFSANGITFGYPVTLSGAPTANNQATTKQYVDTSIANSGTVTSIGLTNGGGIAVSGSPITTSGDISVSVIRSSDATPNYIVSRDANGSFAGNRINAQSVFSNAVTITGSAGSANLNFGTNQAVVAYSNSVTELSVSVNGNAVAGFYPTYTTFNYPANVPLTPTQATHAASKQYVDGVLSNAIANVGGGTVSSVGITPGFGIQVGNSPVTAAGSITVGVVASSTNTPDAIIKRNSAGDFAAGNITATGSLTGNGFLVRQINGFASLNFTDSSGSNLQTGIRYINSSSGLVVNVNNGTPVTFYNGNTTFLQPVLVPTPTLSSSATTKTYVDSAVANVAAQSYTLPTATGSTLGGVKVGAGLSISNGVLTTDPGAVTLNTTQTFTAVKTFSSGLFSNGVFSTNNAYNFGPGPNAGRISVAPLANLYTFDNIGGGTPIAGLSLVGLSLSGKTAVPTPTGATNAFLRADGTWSTVTGTGISQIVAGSGLTGGTITSPGGTITVDSTVLRSNVAQSVTSLKTFTGGVISQAYNFTPTGSSIFYADNTYPSYQEPVVQIAVDNFYAHQFYKKRFVVEGSADYTTPGSNRPHGGAIIGIDNGSQGGAGVSGWHTQAVPGLGIGVGALTTNAAFTGAMFQSTAGRAKGPQFVHLRCYSSSSTTPDAVFEVNGRGDIAMDGNITTPAGDYAEYFEWADGNPSAEDRVGRSVTLIGNKIKLAEQNDAVIGIISAVPAIIGDGAELKWKNMYLTDEWGRTINEPYHVFMWTDKDGKSQSCASYEDQTNVPSDAVRSDTDPAGNPFVRLAINPDYDPDTKYIPRSKRKEWAPVGLLGKLRMRKGQPVNPNWIKLRDITDSIEEYLVK